jgi:hypothetical protein
MTISKKFLFLLPLLAMAVFLAVNFRKLLPEKQEPATTARVRKKIYDFDPLKCPGETIAFKVPDPYLRGLLNQGDSAHVIINFFCQNPISRGQLVLYRFSEFDDPVLRLVAGTPGDRFEVLESPEKDGWKIKINGKIHKGFDGQDYVFGGDLPPPLANAAESRGGKLGEEDLIVFCTYPPGDRDSGTFGVVSVKDIIGKAMLKDVGL